jgi:hypothetical protein
LLITRNVYDAAIKAVFAIDSMPTAGIFALLAAIVMAGVNSNDGAILTIAQFDGFANLINVICNLGIA